MRLDQRLRPTGLGEAVLFDECHDRAGGALEPRTPCDRPLLDARKPQDLDWRVLLSREGRGVLAGEVHDDDLHRFARRLRAEPI